MHMDPENFPEPERFNPDRFSPENRGSIKSGSFMPFGAGARTCMGTSLVKMEAKVIAIQYDNLILAQMPQVC